MARNVVVSGGGTGIGRATARRFALGGDHVTIIGRRENVLTAAVSAINADVGARRVRSLAADLSDPDAVAAAAATIVADENPVDVVVNNAGSVGSADGEGLAAVASDWEGELRGNVLTAVLLTEALDAALRRPGASIINVSSIAAVAGGGDSYSGAKAAIIGWTFDLSMRLAPDVRVNAVVPGFIEGTEFFGDRMTEERRQRLIERALLRRAGTPDDVAGGVFFLASADAAYVTGQLLHVNGGALLGR
jgi:NAD(P)-dependent dehydrogenase (short-subunit alcohol dehydrogenase family)